MSRNQGFTLIELMIVVAIIAIISAIAIPSLLNARISGNEASAIASLRTLSTVSEQYRGRFAEYPGATTGAGLADLANVALQPAPYIDGTLGAGLKSGFGFVYNGALNTWDCTCAPTNNNVGVRSFFCDQSGVIRVEADFWANGAATVASPAID